MMPTKPKKLTLLALLAVASFVSIFVIPTSCGRRSPEMNRMQVNDRATVLPIPIESSLSQLPEQPAEKLLIMMSSGSNPVSADSGAVVRFYDSHDSDTPSLEIAASDFPFMHLRTGCASSDVEFLDNGLDSDMLICDGSLDVSRIVRMELEYPSGKKKTATSFSPESFSEGVLSLGVMFH